MNRKASGFLAKVEGPDSAMKTLTGFCEYSLRSIYDVSTRYSQSQLWGRTAEETETHFTPNFQNQDCPLGSESELTLIQLVA